MIPFNKENWEYHFFNVLIFVFIILMAILLKTDVIAIKCVYAELGEECRTCGLTRSFQQLLSGEMRGVPLGHGLLFLLFTSQLIIRLVVSWLVEKYHSVRQILILDIILSLVIIIWTMKELLWE